MGDRYEMLRNCLTIPMIVHCTVTPYSLKCVRWFVHVANFLCAQEIPKSGGKEMWLSFCHGAPILMWSYHFVYCIMWKTGYFLCRWQAKSSHPFILTTKNYTTCECSCTVCTCFFLFFFLFVCGMLVRIYCICFRICTRKKNYLIYFVHVNKQQLIKIILSNLWWFIWNFFIDTLCTPIQMNVSNEKH